MTGTSGVRRLRVLLVEDEAVIAMDLEQWLGELGFEIVGPFKRTSDALEALDALGQMTVDFGVLDYLLGDENSGSVAHRLDRLRVPYVFVTGCHELRHDDAHRAAPKLEKPICPDQVVQALYRLRASAPAGGIESHGT